jgi:hypothetical protein
MNIRRVLILPVLLVSLLIASGTGCKKAETYKPPLPLAPAALSPDTVIRVHWLGKRHLGVTAGAFYLTRLWELPDTKRLESQTLEKLSSLPWRIAAGDAAAQNAPPPLLRPLMDDLVREECYFEIRQAPGRPQETVFAIRLDDRRAGLWRTNLVAAIASLTSVQTMDVLQGGNGWALKRDVAPNRIELSRVDDWTVLSAGAGGGVLLQEISARIKQSENGTASSAADWLDIDIDLRRLNPALLQAAGFSNDLPQVSLSINGDGGNMLTRGQLTFPSPFASELDPWVVPTDLVRGPLAGFTAVRGFGQSALFSKWWKETQIATSPNQGYFWAREGNAFQTYLAAPLPDAGREIRQVSDRLLTNGNPWLAANGYVGFDRSPSGFGVTWGNQPTVRPFLDAVDAGAGPMAVAGMFPLTDGNASSIPPAFLKTLAAETNLVVYDWEVTGARVEASMELCQLVRLILRRPQLPLDSAGVNWLRTITPHLGKSETLITRTSDRQLAFERKATVGLTGIELNLLVDWLESPRFPMGLHSTQAAVAQKPSP